MALRRSGCDSPWLHHFIGHEEDSNPRRSDRRTRGAEAPIPPTRSAICIAAGAANTRGSTEMPDQFPAERKKQWP